jgi:hypothetical protein
MSLLAPLYFAGALAVALPIVFHLIRQRPKSQRQFSSLMFLDETPPRLTRRSRLDQWPLLLLRSLALLLLAAAFARPFFRSIDVLDAQSPPQRVVLMIDTSASMQRSGLWQQSMAQAEQVIADLGDQDRLAIVSFDRQPTMRMGLQESAALSADARRQAARAILADLSPTWNATDLSAALIAAADATTDDVETPIEVAGDAASDIESTAMVGGAMIHLISDMQTGGNVSQLQSFVWPTPVQVMVRRVSPESRTNAAAFVMVDDAATDPTDKDSIRVRVVNSPDSRGEQFALAWQSSAETSNNNPSQGDPITVQVPPGQTRVVRMPAPSPGTTSMVLRGDDHDFDNTRYISVSAPRPQTIGFFGDDTDDPRRSLFYYLAQAPLNDRTRTVTTERMTDAQIVGGIDATIVPLVVVANPLSPPASGAIKKYMDAGGRTLFVLDDPSQSAAMAETIDRIVDGSLRITEATVDDYHMLSQIQFSDPMFDAMADPQFNDFTKIRFWSHRSVDGLDDSWNVTARFDDGDVAIARRGVGAGQCLLLTAGWQPQSSQLALSTKFIPLVSQWLGSVDSRFSATQIDVGDPLPIRASQDAPIRDTESSDTDMPGLVSIDDGGVPRTIAVNVAASESETEPVDDEVLEQFGITLGQTSSAINDDASRRQLRDRELESRQSVWRWLLIAALVFLSIETWWAGRLSRSAKTVGPDPTPTV